MAVGRKWNYKNICILASRPHLNDFYLIHPRSLRFLFLCDKQIFLVTWKVLVTQQLLSYWYFVRKLFKQTPVINLFVVHLKSIFFFKVDFYWIRINVSVPSRTGLLNANINRIVLKLSKNGIICERELMQLKIDVFTAFQLVGSYLHLKNIFEL